MKIGVMGLGALGLPLAVAFSEKGHDVIGYDIFPEKMKKKLTTLEYDEECKYSYAETVEKSSITFADTVQALVDHSDIVFVAVQTPTKHKDYMGTKCVHASQKRYDYDYTYLLSAISSLKGTNITKEKQVNIVCTVLPGTTRNKVLPILKDTKWTVSYNPYFVAMGTVVRDLYYPEFILVGCEHPASRQRLVSFYKTISEDAPVTCMTYEEAELTKMVYNTFITTKVMLGNTVMHLCDKTENTSSDVVMGALKKSFRRLISPMYLNGGMVDQGLCHGKDLRALWWYSEKIGLPYDLYDDLVRSTEQQTKYLSDLVKKFHTEKPKLPIVLLGKAFKENTNLDTGSACYMLKELIEKDEMKVKMQYDPFMDSEDPLFSEPAIFVVCVKHDFWQSLTFPRGSVVIDPFRYMPERHGVEYYFVGINYKSL